jgi:hypothetical protein
MYYVPVVYYWINNDNIYKNVNLELKDSLEINKKNFYETHNRIKKSLQPSDNKHILLIEKTSEYIEYKSTLIRLILINYTHYYPNGIGKELLEKIFEKWDCNKNISEKRKKFTYERTITNIVNYEKTINNIEEILMLISIQILEYYYE